MLARVVRGPLCPGQRDAAIRLYEQSVLPTLQAQAGFRGALLLMERCTEHMAALTLWDEVTMEADPALFRRLLALFDGLLAAPFTVEHYEVSAAALAPLVLPRTGTTGTCPATRGVQEASSPFRPREESAVRGAHCRLSITTTAAPASA